MGFQGGDSVKHLPADAGDGGAFKGRISPKILSFFNILFVKFFHLWYNKDKKQVQL